MELSELVNMSMVNTADERPFEYAFTWKWLAVFLSLPRALREQVRVLDVGGGDSRLAKTLADLGFNVTVIDIGDVEHGKAKFLRANILELELPIGFFNVAIAISTIEHIGLPCYGQNIVDEDGDIKAMHKIWMWLRQGGIAIVTLPYGKPHHPYTFERVYNQETLCKRILADKWEILEEAYVADIDGWRFCTEEEARNRDAAIMLVLRKP